MLHEFADFYIAVMGLYYMHKAGAIPKSVNRITKKVYRSLKKLLTFK